MYNRTIGEIIKDKRLERGSSLEEVSHVTKINLKYLEGIETNNFEVFGSKAQAKGFIRNYGQFLGLEADFLLAIYKRDYEKEVHTRSKVAINVEDLSITPRKIQLGIIVVIVLVFVVFLLNVVINAFKPPYFKLTSPLEGYNSDSLQFITSNKSIRFSGETQGFTLIKINGIPLSLNSGFRFESEELPTTSESNIFYITAESQLGSKSDLKIEIIRDDIRKANLEKTLVKLSVKDSPAFINALGDGEVQFNDQVLPGKVVTIKASSTIKIETDKPLSIKVEYLGKEYVLTELSEEFEISKEGILVKN